jgi:hypothetical protein
VVDSAWTASPDLCGKGKDSLKMFNSFKQVLLMNKEESSDTMWGNLTMVLDSLPVTVSTTGIAPSTLSGLLSAALCSGGGLLLVPHAL